jgi:hypothetical protein
MARLQAMGLGGETPSRVTYVAGVTKSESLSITTQFGAAHKDENGKTVTAVPLKKTDFAAIPSDVTSVSLIRGGDSSKTTQGAIQAAL